MDYIKKRKLFARMSGIIFILAIIIALFTPILLGIIIACILIFIAEIFHLVSKDYNRKINEYIQDSTYERYKNENNN